MTDAKKNESDVSATEGIIRLSIPFVLVGIVLVLLLKTTVKSEV
jgi:hypothetical protein